ncbi:DUF3891 family protein [Segetibacter sp. 3557_3]|uniref:DUF3891 family protein n=1 Tax=Segetibacter sp. 3557_3 TaxID=2547429 RepID=UPI00105895D4|nr:DUF3891 family protein [Segetibacter sp. 3557_3]TDH19704.1 DUF3891 family protein [Segetibacter sp. 3557_3]
MVVNYKSTGWEVVTQRAHGLLAAQIAMHWKQKERPERWMETLIAIADHDEAEVELDGENLLTETGGPLNFSMKQYDPKHCEQMAMLSITKSRYVALLVSIHMDFLYRKEAAENSQLQKFLEEQRKLQAGWRKELGLQKEEVERIYYLLEWCDAFSLLLCQQQVQPEQRGIEISTGPDGKVYQLFELENGSLTVDPWPFEPNAFQLTCESREINQLQFASSAEFRALFNAAKVKEQVWQVAKQAISKPSKV